MSLDASLIKSLFLDSNGNSLTEVTELLLTNIKNKINNNINFTPDNNVKTAVDAMLADSLPAPWSAALLTSLIKHPKTDAASLAIIAEKTGSASDLSLIININDAARVTAAVHKKIIANNNTATDDLVYLAGIVTDAADLSAIVAKDPFIPAADSVLAVNANTEDTDLVIIAGRTELSVDLHNIVIHSKKTAATDTAVINNDNTLDSDLAAIAERTLLASDLVDIMAHTNLGVLSDSKIINNPEVTDTQLSTIAARTIKTDDLTNIVNSAKHSASSDTAVITNEHTLSDSLVAVAKRTTLENDLDLIVKHPKYHASSDSEVVKNSTATISEEALLTVAGRTELAVDLDNITSKISTVYKAQVGTAVMNNSKLSQVTDQTLITIAENTTAPSQLKKITDLARVNADLDAKIIANNNTAIDELVTIAERTAPHAALLKIAEHTLATSDNLATVVAAINTTETYDADIGTKVTQNANTYSVDLEIIASLTSSAADLAKITTHAKRTVETDNAVINNPNVTVASNPHLREIALRTESKDILSKITDKDISDETLNYNIANNSHTKPGDLDKIAMRTEDKNVLEIIANKSNILTVLVEIINKASWDTAANINILKKIAIHEEHYAASDSSVITKAASVTVGDLSAGDKDLLDDALAVIAGRTLVTGELDKIVAKDLDKADTAVLFNTLASEGNLLAIAERTGLAADLVKIAVHGHRAHATDEKVIASQVTSDDALLSIVGYATTTETDITNIVDNKTEIPKTDSAIVKDSRASPSNLSAIASRTTKDSDLHYITIHSKSNATVDHAVINNSLTLDADLAVIAKRSVSAADLNIIANHTKAGADTFKEVAFNDKTQAEGLKIIAKKTSSAIDLHKIVGTKKADLEVANNANTNEDDLLIITDRNENINILTNVVNNDNCDQACDEKIINKDNNVELNVAILNKIIARSSTTTAMLKTIVKRNKYSRDMDSAVVDHDNVDGELLKTIANASGDLLILDKIATHDKRNKDSDAAVIDEYIALNRLALEINNVIAIARDTASTDALYKIASGIENNAELDKLIILNSNATDSILAIIAARTTEDNKSYLTDITNHANYDTVTTAAIAGNNNITVDENIIAVFKKVAAKSSTSGDTLEKISEKVKDNAELDALIVNHANAGFGALIRIASRNNITMTTANLKKIAEHDDANLASDRMVINNPNANDEIFGIILGHNTAENEDLLVIAERTTLKTNLNKIVNNYPNDTKLHIKVANNVNTNTMDLKYIFEEENKKADKNTELLTAIAANANTDAVTLKAIIELDILNIDQLNKVATNPNLTGDDLETVGSKLIAELPVTTTQLRQYSNIIAKLPESQQLSLVPHLIALDDGELFTKMTLSARIEIGKLLVQKYL